MTNLVQVYFVSRDNDWLIILLFLTKLKEISIYEQMTSAILFWVGIKDDSNNIH